MSTIWRIIRHFHVERKDGHELQIKVRHGGGILNLTLRTPVVFSAVVRKAKKNQEKSQ